MKKPPMKGKYTKKSDDKMDSYLTKKAGFDKDEKEKFEKMDKAHGKKKKPKTLQEDLKADTKIIKKIKASEKKEDKKEKKKK